MNRIGLLTSLLVCALVVGSARAEDKLVGSPYCPLEVGTTWTYSVVDTPDAPKLILKVTSHEKVGDLLCARLETSVNGNMVAYEHITMTKEGVCRVGLGTLKAEPPILLLKLPPREGDTWTFDGKVGTEIFKGSGKVSAEAVTVPAGKYTTFLSKLEAQAGDQKIVMSNYFARGVGIVRMNIEFPDAGKTVVVVLEKFEAGK
jgi:hypothetical protein